MFKQKVEEKVVKGPYTEIEIQYEEGPKETIGKNHFFIRKPDQNK